MIRSTLATIRDTLIDTAFAGSVLAVAYFLGRNVTESGQPMETNAARLRDMLRAERRAHQRSRKLLRKLEHERDAGFWRTLQADGIRHASAGQAAPVSWAARPEPTPEPRSNADRLSELLALDRTFTFEGVLPEGVRMMPSRGRGVLVDDIQHGIIYPGGASYRTHAFGGHLLTIALMNSLNSQTTTHDKRMRLLWDDILRAADDGEWRWHDEGDGIFDQTTWSVARYDDNGIVACASLVDGEVRAQLGEIPDLVRQVLVLRNSEHAQHVRDAAAVIELEELWFPRCAAVDAAEETPAEVPDGE